MTDTELLNFLDETPRWEIEKPHNHLVHAVIVKSERRPIQEETIREAIVALAASTDLTAPRPTSQAPGFNAADLRKALTDLLPFVMQDFYPGFATPGFATAVVQAHAALNIPLPTPEPTMPSP